MKLAATPTITVDPTQPKPWYASIAEQLLEANKVRQVQQINKERLAKGLPPLTDAEMRSLTGSVNAQVSLPPEAKFALYAVGGLAAIFLIRALMK
jgi:hypothetical protein